MTELEILKKEIVELKNRQAWMQSILDEIVKPTNLYIKELARECSRGNWQALRDHNKRESLRKNAKR